jgi:hypothetical protein
MDDHLCLIIMCEKHKHLRVVGAKGIRDIRVKQLNVGVALCRLLVTC